MSTAHATLSDLINKPRATLAPLTGSFVHRIHLRRRDDVDLVLTTEARYDQEQTVVRAATRLLAALVNHGQPARDLVHAVLPDVFPWVRFLPDEDRVQFVAELVGTLRAADDFDNLGPAAQAIVEWKHTAEVHADPAVAAVLRRDAEDGEAISPPSAA